MGRVGYSNEFRNQNEEHLINLWELNNCVAQLKFSGELPLILPRILLAW